MAFWSQPTLEPKRLHRWILSINNIDAFVCKDVDKPKMEITEVEHWYLNHAFYYPGRVKWEPISVTLVDPVDPDVSERLLRMIHESGYEFPEDANDTRTISKVKATIALGTPRIKQIGPEGETIEEWQLINGWARNIDFGKLTYAEDGMLDITLQIRFDYAKQVK